MNKKEVEYESVMNTELAQRIMDKAVLENQIPELQKQVDGLESQKKSLIESIEIVGRCARRTATYPPTSF